MRKRKFRNIIIGAVTVVIMLTGCEKLLDQTNPNSITPDTFWQNASDANANLTAVYSSFREQYYYRIIPMQFRGDDIQVTHGAPAYFQFNQFTLTDANSTVGTAWSQNYTGIFLANQAIQYIPGTKNMDDGLKKRMVGEAKFLRAYFYFTLFLEFKNIPIITSIPASSEDYAVAQATPQETLAQIEKDLTDACAVLPETYPASDQGRITKGAALGILGKCQMFQKKWKDAAGTFEAIIKSNKYGLMSNFSDVFLEANDFNKENLLEVNYAKGSFNGAAMDNPENKREAFSQAGGWYIYWPSKWLFDEMTKEKTVSGELDPRVYATIIFPNTKMTYYGMSYQALKGNSTEMGFAKYSEWEFNRKLTANSGKNERILRYSDILLLYAEALNNLEQTSKAIYYVDLVRERANLSKLPEDMSKGDLMEEIEHQRIVELADESNRFFDLLRWGGNISGTMSIKEVLGAHGAEGAAMFVEGKSEYLPIPVSELQTNPKMKP